MTNKLKEFQELMGWDNEEMIARFHWAECVGAKLCAEALEAEYDAYLEEYYSDYDAEMMRETMWATEHC